METIYFEIDFEEKLFFTISDIGLRLGSEIDLEGLEIPLAGIETPPAGADTDPAG
jgi:hypothetical protein